MARKEDQESMLPHVNEYEGSNTTSSLNNTEPLDGVIKGIKKLSIESCSKEKKSDQTEQRIQTGKEKLQSWLNKSMKIEMSDGRILIGNFLCTDRDANVILGACTEFLNPEVCGFSDEPRLLGLVMVPGRHIVSIYLEIPTTPENKPATN